jgi:N-formylglutamate amidohydrolase
MRTTNRSTGTFAKTSTLMKPEHGPVRSGMAPAVIVHLPHASRLVPSAVRDQFVVTDAELEAELARLTDHATDRLFATDDPRVQPIVFPVSRLVVDPERFEHDADEPMAARGQGVIYTHTCDGGPLRRPLTDDEREQLLNAYYRPHHRRLAETTQLALAAHGRALIIDAHSFPNRPLPVDLDQSPGRPDICVGTDPFHTPAGLRDAVGRVFSDAGYRVEIDRPYRGTLVPSFAWRKDPRVASIMIEVNRRLYLEAERHSPVRIGGLLRLRRTLKAAVDAVTGWHATQVAG